MGDTCLDIDFDKRGIWNVSWKWQGKQKNAQQIYLEGIIYVVIRNCYSRCSAGIAYLFWNWYGNKLENLINILVWIPELESKLY